MERFKNKFFLGVALSVLAVVAEAVLIWILHDSKLLPGRFILIIGLGLGIVTAAGILLALQKNKLWIFGNAWLALLLVCSVVLSILVQMGVQALRDNVFVEIPDGKDVICVLVDKADPANKIEDTKEYTFGIMESVDVAETEGMQELLAQQYGITCRVKAYDDLSVMLQALLAGGEIQAVIVNPYYLDLAADVMDDKELKRKVRTVFYEEIDRLPGMAGSSTEETTDSTEGSTEDPDLINGLRPFAVYITGIDGDFSLSSKSNSDVNIIVVVNPIEKQVMLLSTPRDYYIQLPVKGELQPDKLTHAGCYGIDVSMETIEILYGIELDYYFKVNFSGFKKIINALGGVTVYSDYAFAVEATGHVFIEGYNQLDGAAALAFVRERKHVPGGDETRGKHQLKVIRALLEKVMSPALLLNYTSVLKSLEKSFSTDVPYDLVASLVRNVIEEGAGWEILTHSVSGTNAKKWVYSMSKWMPDYAINDVMIPNEEQVQAASELLNAMLRGERVTLPKK